MRHIYRYFSIFLCVLMAACSEPASGPVSEPTAAPTLKESPVPGRWYTQSQVAAGEPLYQQYCAVCHAADGSATDDWRTPDSTGNYPPPPLNGSAHTWHHPREVLSSTIMEGGVRFGGVMPGFAGALSEADGQAIIAWFQHLWSDEIYAKWAAIDARD